MLREGIYHQPYGNYAYPVGEDTLFIQLRTKKGDLQRVTLFYDGRFRDWKNNPATHKVEMEKYSSDELFDYFRAEISYSKKKFKYFFLLDDGIEQLYYTYYGFDPELPNHKGLFQYTYICEKDYFDTPEWVKDGVFYQIFPERFCNGNPDINPEKVEEWGQLPKSRSFYGGDLPGIISKLDYLEELGVTAIYLTPVFEASTNHKYDTIDYMKIDPCFGTLEDCKELVQKAHQKGIKIVFDGVFNHSSNDFFAFKDLREKGEESEYKGWYYYNSLPIRKNPDWNYSEIREFVNKIREYDKLKFETIKEEVIDKLETGGELFKEYLVRLASYLDGLSGGEVDIGFIWKVSEDKKDLREIIMPNYETFANAVWRMPKLKTANPEVRDYILEVARYWVEEIGIDGWRLDVADEVDHYFWREFRKVVKEANPEAYIVGESWGDSSPWLDGDQFDGVMNYLFTEAVLDFFCKREISVNTFEARLSKVRTTYKLPAQEASLNLVDSHDTARVLTIAKKDKVRQRLAAAFQMTYLGAPMIYYGDEIGLEGGDDPDCRRTMVWDKDKQDRELFNWYKKLIKIRKDNPALRTGDFKLLKKDAVNNIYSFLRTKGDNNIIVAFNNYNIEGVFELELDDMDYFGDSLTDLISDRSFKVKDKKLTIKINPYDLVILK
ncbi:alpha-glycosidase [Halonatronum saccharophilum]|uniref:alpha-glycosidase n=1 Tax=Halonatronum saccharophilum TaxID=150060 RepID=UPI000481157B|nr:alpha-glycosidase [Halonatronum saccharophilum]